MREQLLDEVKPVDQFLAAVKQEGLWKSIDLRVLAVNVDGEWHNIMTRAYLDFRTPKKAPHTEHLPSGSLVKVWQDICSVRSLRRMLQEVAKGCLTVQDDSVFFHSDSFKRDRAPRPYNLLSSAFHEHRSRFARNYNKWACHELVGYGDGTNDLFVKIPGGRNAIDRFLRAADHPIDGVDGIAADILGSPEQISSSRAATFEIFAPFCVKIDRGASSLRGELLALKVVGADERAIKNCTVGYVARTNSQELRRGTLEFSDCNDDESEVVSAELTRRFSGVIEIRLFLRVGADCVESVTFADSVGRANNPFVAGYAALDPGLSAFNDALRTEPDGNAHEFEEAVARLLTFLGLSVDLLGRSKLVPGSVDAIAYDVASATVLVVECTTGQINSGGKIGKLTDRVRRVSDALSSYNVQGVLATPMSRDNLAEGDLLSAREHGLAVLSREDLGKLMTMVHAGRDVETTLSFIQSRIPVRQPNSLGGFGLRRRVR